jgi:ATP-dependent DNA helicase RecQ
MPQYSVKGSIAPEHMAQPGRALCRWGDAGWGSLVRQGKYQDGRFADELVQACVALIGQWKPQPAPQWVTAIPSLRHPHLVPDFARRLAEALRLPYHAVLKKTQPRPEQKTMANSIQQARNVDGSLAVQVARLPTGAVLLVDDMVDSRWTFTVAAWLLRSHDAGPVFPLALAVTAQGSTSDE